MDSYICNENSFFVEDINNLIDKRTWTKEEDSTLLDLVLKNGPGNWSMVAESLPRRTAKQCRERYFRNYESNYLVHAFIIF